jgi:two-component system sensor histidine kinase/response regulator
MIDASYKNANILIVDDNDSNIELLEGLLEATGYFNLKSTNDSRLVMDLFQSFEPDLILLDLTMPHLSGFEVMEELNKVIPAHTYLPILVLTADLNCDTKQRALSAGAKDFLAKPFDLNEVSIRIKNLLETRYLYQLLELQNKNLAQKVFERTQELETAYAEIVVANKELEVLDTAKLEFLKIISHEIRTPLNGILGFTELLKNRIDSPQLLEYVQYLELSADRLQRFSFQALLITELRTHVYKIQPELILVSHVVDETEKLFGKKLHDKGIQLEMDADATFFTIMADRKLFQICVENLIDNALKYSPENAIVSVNAYSTEEGSVVEFTDLGPGFSAEAMANLFNVFGVGEKHVDQNTGLHLSLIRLIMDAHHGDIKIINNQPSGTTVQLIFKTTSK